MVHLEVIYQKHPMQYPQDWEEFGYHMADLRHQHLAKFLDHAKKQSQLSPEDFLFAILLNQKKWRLNRLVVEYLQSAAGSTHLNQKEADKLARSFMKFLLNTPLEESHD